MNSEKKHAAKAAAGKFSELPSPEKTPYFDFQLCFSENGERIKECLAIEREKEDNNAPAITGDVIDRKHDKPILI